MLSMRHVGREVLHDNWMVCRNCIPSYWIVLFAQSDLDEMMVVVIFY